MASVRAFLRFGDVKGEVTERAHRSWIEVTGVSSRQTSGEYEVSLFKNYDSTSPQLYAICASGRVASAVIDEVRSSGGAYLRWEMPAATISSIRGSGTDDPPRDQVTLTCGKIIWKKEPGTPPPSGPRGWQ